MRRLLLYICGLVLLSSCAGKGVLQQRYTHYRHAKHASPQKEPVIASKEKKEAVALLQKKEVSFEGPKRESVLRSMQETVQKKPLKKNTQVSENISLSKNNHVQQQNNSQRSKHKSPDDFATFLVILLSILVGLLLLALIVAIIGLVVLFASRIVLGVILLTLGILGITLWFLTWG